MKKKQHRHIENPHQITIGNITHKANVVKTIPVEEPDMQGQLVTFYIDGYGNTQPVWYPDDGITAAGYNNRISRSLIPPEYIYKRAGDFDWAIYEEDVNAQKKIANAFIILFKEFQTQGRGLYISSQTKGSGKTMLACILANEIIKRYDIAVKFVTSSEYIDIALSKNEVDKEKLKTIMDSSLLIFDDIGTESQDKKWIPGIIYRLVDYRCKHRLPPIYTSNRRPDKLECDENIKDRIISTSTEILMPEVGVRRKKAKMSKDAFIKKILQENIENGIF